MSTASASPAPDLTAAETHLARAVSQKAFPDLQWSQLLQFYTDNAAIILQAEGLPAQIFAAYQAGDVVGGWSLTKQLGDLVIQLEQAWIAIQSGPPPVATPAQLMHAAQRAGFDPKKLGDGTILSTIVNAVISGVKNAGGIGAIISIILKLAGGLKPPVGGSAAGATASP